MPSARIKPPSGAPGARSHREVTDERTEAKHATPFSLSDNDAAGLADASRRSHRLFLGVLRVGFVHAALLRRTAIGLQTPPRLRARCGGREKKVSSSRYYAYSIPSILRSMDHLS